MKIQLASILVDDQDKALRFYTDVLGFAKKTEIPLGEHKWVTVVSTESGAGEIELGLEPNVFPAAKAYQQALFDAGIPLTAFASSNLRAEYERLVAKGVKFRLPPHQQGPLLLALFEDTCGNLIQVYQSTSE